MGVGGDAKRRSYNPERGDQDDEDQHSPEQAEEGDRLEEDELEKRAAEQQRIRMNRRGLWIEREKAARARRK